MPGDVLLTIIILCGIIVYCTVNLHKQNTKPTNTLILSTVEVEEIGLDGFMLVRDVLRNHIKFYVKYPDDKVYTLGQQIIVKKKKYEWVIYEPNKKS